MSKRIKLSYDPALRWVCAALLLGVGWMIWMLLMFAPQVAAFASVSFLAVSMVVKIMERMGL